MPDNIGGFQIKKDLNITNIVGFLVLFATLVTMYNNLDHRQSTTIAWHANHERAHVAFEQEIRTKEREFEISLREYPQNMYRLTQLEEALIRERARLDRMVENYNNQFASMGSQMNNVLTQIALANSTLARLEKVQQGLENKLNPNGERK